MTIIPYFPLLAVVCWLLNELYLVSNCLLMFVGY